MKTKFSLSATGLAVVSALAGVVLLAGCAGTAVAPKPSGFLSQYTHLKQVDPTTWRYVFTNRLALYDKFQITTVKILPEQFDGKFITAEEKTKAADYLRSSLSKALQDHGYQVVNAGGADVAEIHVAITDIYKSKDQLGLTVEGEILDASSGFQAAAVMKTELGDIYLGSWWNGFSARQIVDNWSQRLAGAVDMAHRK